MTSSGKRGQGTRIAVAAVAAAGVVLVAGGCRGNVQASGGQAGPSSAGGPSRAPASGSAAPAPSGSGAPAPSGSAAGQGNCTTGMLHATLASGPSGAGTIGIDLTFTNTSGTTCTLEGNPGIKLADAPSTDQWYIKTGLQPVTLQPGGKASTTITYHDNGGSCAEATGADVTPPGSYSSIYIPARFGMVCEGGALAVTHPLQAGGGTNLGPM